MSKKCYFTTAKIGSRIKKKLTLISDNIVRKRYYYSENGNFATLDFLEKEKVRSERRLKHEVDSLAFYKSSNSTH